MRRESNGRLHAFRIASLLVPPAYAWRSIFEKDAPRWIARDTPRTLDAIVLVALGSLWLATAFTLFVHAVDAWRAKRRDPEGPSLLDRADVLTASGSTLAWAGSFAIVASTWTGWASLSFLGLFAIGLVHAMAIWTIARVGGSDPYRRASVSRRFVPERVYEGEEVVEEIALDAPRVPIGFRMFIASRVGLRWPLTRHVVEARDAGGEIVLEAAHASAVRGDHRAEPLEIWMQDVLGLCRTPRFSQTSARLVVLPKARPVDGVVDVLGPSGAKDDAVCATRLPTEGSMRLREYRPGDDARRIHWARSLAAREIVVRLPDELPRDARAMSVVLDTHFPEHGATTSAAPLVLLDALVEVWMAVARALSERGVRVTMVAAIGGDGALEVARKRYDARGAAEIGAKVDWQRTKRASEIVERGDAIVVARKADASLVDARVTWVLVPASSWTDVQELAPKDLLGFHAHPLASADNRRSRRRRARARFEASRRDRQTFESLSSGGAHQRTRAFVARPALKRIFLEVLP